jgi:hypothetical protein
MPLAMARVTFDLFIVYYLLLLLIQLAIAPF